MSCVFAGSDACGFGLYGFCSTIKGDGASDVAGTLYVTGATDAPTPCVFAKSDGNPTPELAGFGYVAIALGVDPDLRKIAYTPSTAARTPRGKKYF